jgi:hypothetical protein
MKDTLKQLGYDFQEQNQEKFIIGQGYSNITIDAQNHSITYGDGQTGKVNKIKQAYMVNWYKDKAIHEGNDVQEEVKSNGEIVLNIRHA